MSSRTLSGLTALILVMGFAGGAGWWFLGTDTTPKSAVTAEAGFPAPPFPPRFAGGADYDKCLAALDDDPETAVTLAAALLAAGGGDAARHCQALAAVATGEPEAGAKTLEALAHAASTPPRLAAFLLGQACDARLAAEQAEQGLADSNEALAIAPDDTGLLIGHAKALDALDQTAKAMDDLNQALLLDPGRGDALVLRASIWRRMDMLTEARSDIDKAIALDPEDAEALLERGTIRQLMGDREGARQDWIKAQEVDPNSEAAELAAQNLTLLATGPEKK